MAEGLGLEGILEGTGLERALAAAKEAAHAAGRLISEHFGRVRQVEHKASVVDLVTEVDREAERIILSTLRKAFPAWPVIGEEGVPGAQAGLAGMRSPGGLPAGMCWVVDPLDGTTNYVHGVPFVCVSIALYKDGCSVLGVVFDPLRGELFWAVRGRGAFLGGARIAVTARGNMARCVLATGTAVARYGEWGVLMRDLEAVGPRAGNTRMLGSAALHLAYVACGRLDGFWERRLSPWDMAAGALLVEEAGGKVTDPLGRPFTLESHSIVATNGLVHEELLAVLTGLVGDGGEGGQGLSPKAALMPHEAMNLLRESGVYREGHFLLTSGRHSPAFFLLSQAFQHPRHASRLGEALAALFRCEGVETVIGPAMGGVILAHEVARALGVRSLYAEKVSGAETVPGKADRGAESGMALRRGFSLKPGERVLVVEDAVTTGGSVRKVLEVVRQAGAVPVGVGAVVDRSGGKADFGGVPFRALVQLDIPSYDPAGCPLCREGIALTSPKAAL